MRNGRQLAIIFLIIFVNLLGFGIVIPLLPFYADAVGASPLQIGLLFASYSLCQIVASPWLGHLSDQHGRRPILIFSLIGTVASFALLAVANTLFLLFAARIIDGLSGGNISTARAYISDITEEKDRARAYGIIGAAFGLGFIFGPALGGVLGRYGYAAPAWAAAGLAAVALVMTILWLPETSRSSRAARGNPWREMPLMLRRPVLGRLLTLDFLYWASLSVYQTTFALFGKIRFGWEIAEVGYVLAMVGFIGAFIQGGAVGPIVKRFGEKPVFVFGLFLTALGLGIASFAYNPTLFVIALIPAAIGGALSNPTLIAMISQNGEPGEQGRVQGVSGALESLGRTVGPVWGNGMLGAVGEGAAYLSAAVVLLFVGLAGLGIKASPHRAGKPESAPPRG